MISFSASFEFAWANNMEPRPGDILTLSAQFDEAAATFFTFPGGSAFGYNSQSQSSSLFSLSYSAPLQSSSDITPTFLSFEWGFSILEPDEIWGTHNLGDPDVLMAPTTASYYSFAPASQGSCANGLFYSGELAGLHFSYDESVQTCPAQVFQLLSFTFTRIPEPAAHALFASALAALGFVRRRAKRRT